MNNFIDFVVECLLPVILIVAMLMIVVAGGAAAFSIANAHWNCSQYAKTGITTKVMAGECYVLDNNKWVIFGAYIRNYNIKNVE